MENVTQGKWECPILCFISISIVIDEIDNIKQIMDIVLRIEPPSKNTNIISQ